MQICKILYGTFSSVVLCMYIQCIDVLRMIALGTNTNLRLYSSIVALPNVSVTRYSIMCHIYTICVVYLCSFHKYTLFAGAKVMLCSIIYNYVVHSSFMLYIRLYLYLSKSDLMLQGDL